MKNETKSLFHNSVAADVRRRTRQQPRKSASSPRRLRGAGGVLKEPLKKFHSSPWSVNPLVALVLLLFAGALPVDGQSVADRLSRQLFYDEHIVQVGPLASSEQEAQLLLETLDAWRASRYQNGVEQLEEFLNTLTNSPWAPSLDAVLGKYYNDVGRYTLALEHYELAWAATKSDATRNGKRVADLAFANWTRLLASLGRIETLDALFQETRGRVLDRGPLSQKWARTWEAIAEMRQKPGISYKCGTFALNNVARALRLNYDAGPLMREPSPTTGFSLQALTELSTRLRLGLVPVHRESGQEIPVPSVVHWRQNHYAAIISLLLSLTDGKGQTTKWNYDEYGRVTNKVDQAGVEILRYKYDANSRLTNRWSKAKTDTYYSYNNVGSLTNINYPVSADIGYQYDALNRLTNMVDAAGTSAYAYTSGGLLWTEDGPWTSDTVTNIYYNRLRTNLTLVQPTGMWTNRFAYDLPREIAPLTAVELLTQRSHCRLPGGFQSDYLMGRAKALTEVASPASPGGTFTYLLGAVNVAGPLPKKITLGNTSYITNTYDSMARLTGTYLKTSGNVLTNKHEYIYPVR